MVFFQKRVADIFKPILINFELKINPIMITLSLVIVWSKEINKAYFYFSPIFAET